MAKKMKMADDFMYHLYVHMNDVDHFVVYSGLSLKQFFAAMDPMKNILLLKHSYEDGSYNMHTQFDYISSGDMPVFMKKLPDMQKDFCWVDFDSEKNVNSLTPHEQAELLYFSHKREPLLSAFSNKLQNRYAYYHCASDKMTKIYFRFLADSEMLVSNVFNQVIREKEGTGSFWRRKARKSTPNLDSLVLRGFRSFAKEGALLSLYMDKSGKYGIEVRTLANYNFPDEVWDDLKEILKVECDEVIHV